MGKVTFSLAVTADIQKRNAFPFFVDFIDVLTPGKNAEKKGLYILKAKSNFTAYIYTLY